MRRWYAGRTQEWFDNPYGLLSAQSARSPADYPDDGAWRQSASDTAARAIATAAIGSATSNPACATATRSQPVAADESGHEGPGLARQRQRGTVEKHGSPWKPLVAMKVVLGDCLIYGGLLCYQRDTPRLHQP
jgi:hypothetical protein